jgi:hypothetical protein
MHQMIQEHDGPAIHEGSNLLGREQDLGRSLGRYQNRNFLLV